MASTIHSNPLQITFRPIHHPQPPPHHVLPQPSFLSYLSPNPSPAKPKPISFINPWPSFRKRSLWDYAAPLRWDKPTEPGTGPNEEAPEKIGKEEMRREHREEQREEVEMEVGRQQRKRLREMLPVSMPKLSRTSTGRISLSRTNSTTTAAAQLEDPDASDAELQIKTVEPDFGGAWDTNKGAEARATWLGHAGVMLQLPPLGSGKTPVRMLFDPVFSMRCSPSQIVGPYRYAPPPCAISDLPAIDFVFISHNHYDHLDTDTIVQLYQLHGASLHFFVPLGVREWFVTTGIPEEQVTEMDWWDEADVEQRVEYGHEDLGFDELELEGARLRIICTPAQHGSNRYGYDGDTTLWASWYVEHITPPSPSAPHKEEKSFRTYFAGDTGLRWTDDGETTLPSPSSSISPRRSVSLRGAGGSSGSASPLKRISSLSSGLFSSSPLSSPISPTETDLTPLSPLPAQPLPICPAFSDVSHRLGPPDLALLPISVGASLSFLRAYSPFPAGMGYAPPLHLSKSFTSAIHMTPGDAVEVHRIFERAKREGWGVGGRGIRGDDVYSKEGKSADDDDGNSTRAIKSARSSLYSHSPSPSRSPHSHSHSHSRPPPPPQPPRQPISLGIHFGTWCSGEQEVRGTVRDLRKSCLEQGVRFGRTVPVGVDADTAEGVGKEREGEGEEEKGRFIVINHGETISLRF